MTNITVSGNVEGSIVVGDNNVVVNNNYGTIIQQASSVEIKKIPSRPPRKPLNFVGRKKELDQVERLLASRTPTVVHGLDGIGKTSLVKQAANSEFVSTLQDGVLYLEGADEAGELLPFDDLTQRLFDLLFQSTPELKVNQVSARKYFSDTQPLVLLNSVSIPPDGLGKLIDMFPQAPVLIASEGAGPRNSYKNVLLGPMNPDDSLALLADTMNAEDLESLTQLASLLENIPAALIAVANVISDKGLDLEEALSRLQAYTPAEKDKAKAALDRAFAFIFSTLNEEEKGMLLQVAAAPGISTDREWLESVCGGQTVSEKMESLQLLQANSPRLRLMPGLRQFLQQGRDLTLERQRLLDHLLKELKTRWNDFEFIQNELGNLLGLLTWAAAQGQWANVAALGRAIDPYLTLRGLWESWHETLGEVRRAANEMKDAALQGWVLHQLGTYEIGMGNLSAGRNLLEQAVTIRKGLGDETGAAYSQHNLQFVAPVGKSPKWIPWLIGGLTVIGIAAFLFLRSPSNNPPQPTAVPVVLAPSEVNTAIPPSITPGITSTLTETPSSSPTATETSTAAPTETPTALPTYTVLSKIVVKDIASCFYGPGTVYLNKGTRRIVGNTVDVLGRIETDKGVWVNTRFSLPRTDPADPCWMDAKYLEITPEQLMSVNPIDPANPDEYSLPIDYFSRNTRLQDPPLKGVTRADDQVNISWEYFDVGKGEYESENSYRYLIEAWVCRDGKIVFSPSGWGPYGPDVVTGVTVSASIQDESGCPEPSHARLYLAWVHGYAGPVEIRPWP